MRTESAVALAGVPLSAGQFARIANLLYDHCGINLKDGKEELVKSRLQKRLRQLALDDFDAYLQYLQGADGEAELVTMVDLLTTNKTDFFREPRHFDFVREVLLREQADSRRVRIWCAGCSTGEEPYTLAVTLHEATAGLGGWDAKILATDISTKVLDKCRSGVYEWEKVGTLPGPVLTKYFACVAARPPRQYQVSTALRRIITFARLNLMGDWPMRGPFDAIFCRNVMIYFDKPTQARLIERYRQLLRPGGYLLVGHSESLAGIDHGLKYLEPAVYRKS